MGFQDRSGTRAGPGGAMNRGSPNMAPASPGLGGGGDAQMRQALVSQALNSNIPDRLVVNNGWVAWRIGNVRDMAQRVGGDGRKDPIQSQWFKLNESRRGYHCQIRFYPFGSKPAAPGSCSLYLRMNFSGEAETKLPKDQQAKDINPPLTLRFTMFFNGLESESLECLWNKANKDKGKHDMGDLSTANTGGGNGDIVVGFHLLGIDE